jgi:hypothetical protein
MAEERSMKAQVPRRYVAAALLALVAGAFAIVAKSPWGSVAYG